MIYFVAFDPIKILTCKSLCAFCFETNLDYCKQFSIFQIISEKSDTEWKFSRTKLWISFFETGSTVPPPFNIMPTPKVPSMSFNPDFIQILSRFYPDFIQIFSRFKKKSLYPNFIQILSTFFQKLG